MKCFLSWGSCAVRKIGLDTRMLRYSGIGTYVRNLISEILLLPQNSFQFHCFGETDNNWLPGSHIKNDFSAKIYSLREQWEYPRYLSRVDLWHAPHFNVPLRGEKKWLVTVHDIIPWLFAGRFYSAAQRIYVECMMSAIKKNARAVIAVSQSTKNDLIRYFHFDAARVHVIHEAVDAKFQIADDLLIKEVRQKYHLPAQQKYLLFVGNLKAHKNLGLLLEAVRNLRKAGKIDHQLLVVGGKDGKYAVEHAYLADLKSDADMVYLEKISSGELPAVYRIADIFIQPSLYEGFGLPVLEAFASGIPVIVSNRASLPEISGSAALVFDAESRADLENQIMRLAADAGLREQCRAAGLKRVQDFSWKNTALKTLEIYQSLS